MIQQFEGNSCTAITMYTLRSNDCCVGIYVVEQHKITVGEKSNTMQGS